MDLDGFDCIGIAELLGYRFSDSIKEKISRNFSEKEIENEELNFEKIDVPKEGSLILFRLNKFWHLGIYLGSNRFIHVFEDKGVKIDILSKWKTFVRGYYVQRHNWMD